MQLLNRIQAFTKLGRFMSQFSDNNYLKKENIPYNNLYFNKMVELIKQSKSHNGWFNESNIQFALKSWGECLTENNLQKWTAQYNIDNSTNKEIAIILAGNIPLVGFHDFLSVLISGNNVIAKLSSNDNLLLPFLANYLIELEPVFEDKINFTLKCNTLMRKKITVDNINNKLDGLKIIQMQDGGMDLDVFLRNSRINMEIFGKMNASLEKLLANAILPMNAMNVFHLDLKASNMMIDDNYNVKIVDWGLSTVITDFDVIPREFRRPLHFNMPYSVIILNKDFFFLWQHQLGLF